MRIKIHFRSHSNSHCVSGFFFLTPSAHAIWERVRVAFAGHSVVVVVVFFVFFHRAAWLIARCSDDAPFGGADTARWMCDVIIIINNVYIRTRCKSSPNPVQKSISLSHHPLRVSSNRRFQRTKIVWFPIFFFFYYFDEKSIGEMKFKKNALPEKSLYFPSFGKPIFFPKFLQNSEITYWNRKVLSFSLLPPL